MKGGIVSELTRAMGEEGANSSEIGFDIKVLKGKVGGTDKENTLRTEKIEKESGAVFVDEIFIDRVKTFLNTFSPNRLNFRLDPFDIFSDFQILANLKSEYLVNGSFENVIFTYGSRPNVRLSVFGIVTSCPQKEDVRVDLNDEYLGYEEDELKDEAAFEKAFRGVFSSFEAFEKFFFVQTYPKISVSPIAIYREVKIE